jgi:hypothetical protein
MTYYRIQPADRDTADLLDEATWQSCNWSDPWAEPRYGVSVCGSLDDLVDYFRAASGYVDDTMVVVELLGDLSDEDDEDAHVGALLVCPSRIVSVEPVTTDLLARIYPED